jgi:hypothetical protein
MRYAILDDYQDVALSFADWASLEAETVVFAKPFAHSGDLVHSLAGLDPRSWY